MFSRSDVKPHHTNFRDHFGPWSLHFSADSQLKEKLDLTNKETYFLKPSPLLLIIYHTQIHNR